MKKPTISVNAVANIPADRAGSAPSRFSVMGIKTPMAPEATMLMTIDAMRIAESTRSFLYDIQAKW